MPAAPLCADCQKATGSLEVRRRRLCRDCFILYVNTKIVKRMVSFRNTDWHGDHKQKLLLPLSGGPASLTLLHVLDAQLARQTDKHSRTAYDIIILHIRTTGSPGMEQITDWRQDVTTQFPRYTFLEPCELSNIFQMDNSIEEDLRELSLQRDEGEDDANLLTRLFTSMRTATAKADLEEVFVQRLTVGVAKKEGCEAILWGHSNSRLAAKALADVAKGRGGSVPVFMTDGPSPFGLEFNHPMRDLFQSEVDLYLKCVSEYHGKCLLQHSADAEAPVSIRNTSIDNLLNGYITSQGEKYPSIMANVVRTASKLQTTTQTGGLVCKLCSAPATSNGTGNFCYGCDRMKQDIKI